MGLFLLLPEQLATGSRWTGQLLTAVSWYQQQLRERSDKEEIEKDHVRQEMYRNPGLPEPPIF